MIKMGKNCMQSIITAVLTLVVLAACSVEKPADLAQPPSGTSQQPHGQINSDVASTGLQEQSLPALFWQSLLQRFGFKPKHRAARK